MLSKSAAKHVMFNVLQLFRVEDFFNCFQLEIYINFY